MQELDPKLDQAARIAWMYHVEGAKQDEIAREVGLSRQGVQRALALARGEGLIKIRLDHPVAACMELARALRTRFSLEYCDVAAAMPSGDALRPIAVTAAAKLESYLNRKEPLTLGIGTGRTMRAMIDEISRIACPQHRLVSRVGVISPDGATNPFDAMTWLADKTGARSYQLPAPIMADSPDDREHVEAQRLYRLVAALARRADVSFIGIGTMDEQAPLRLEGCITRDDIIRLRGAGAVGELTGWILDRDGNLIADEVNERVTSVPVKRSPERLLIGVAGGLAKLEAIDAALRGRWLSGLVTDEIVARSLLERSGHDPRGERETMRGEG